MALGENAELEELIRRTTTGTEATTPASNSAGEDDSDGASSFDLATLVLVARKSLPWAMLLLLLGLIGSWTYLRYTKPVYKATSVLKMLPTRLATARPAATCCVLLKY
jgi:tyrosine-protein kinase Etk/Wzc